MELGGDGGSWMEVGAWFSNTLFHAIPANGSLRNHVHEKARELCVVYIN